MNWNNLDLTEEHNSNFNSIDLTKFIAAILVVSIHTKSFDSYNVLLNFSINNIIARLAVPFFFIVGGYFLFKKIKIGQKEKNITIIKKYTWRLMRVYISWSIIYTPIIIYQNLNNNRSAFLDALLYIRNVFLVGSYTQLWYLLSLIIAIWIIYVFCVKEVRLNTILQISIICYVIGLFGQSYYGLIEDIPMISFIYEMYFKFFYTTRNGVFFGFPYVVIGMYFAKRKLDITITKAIWGLLISFACMVVEITLLEKYTLVETHNMYLFLIPTSFFIFYILSNMEFKNRTIYKELREISTLIFCSHMVFLFFSRYLLELVGLNVGNSLIRFTFTVIFSVIFSVVVRVLEEKKKIKWLRILH